MEENSNHLSQMMIVGLVLESVESASIRLSGRTVNGRFGSGPVEGLTGKSMVSNLPKNASSILPGGTNSIVSADIDLMWSLQISSSRKTMHPIYSAGSISFLNPAF